MRYSVMESVKQVMSAVQFTEGGEFRPTLVMGLGGSGVETARRLKRILRERYQMNTLISFLFMDTDEGVYTEDGDLAAVEEYERASVAVHNPEKLISEIRRNPNLHPYFQQFLDDGIDVVILKDAIGAAGIRPVGRFAFHASFDTIYPGYITPAIQRIMQVRTLAEATIKGAPREIKVTSSQPRIYIISSLCGGTGSGIFLDTAIVVRHLMEQHNLDGEIVGIFYLPSVFSHESGISSTLMEVIEANAYAGLMELEYFCNPKHVQEERWTFTYPMVGELRLKEPLFDEVFLIEGTNAKGQGVTSKRDAFEMVARSLMLDIGSPLGARARSAKRNSLAVIETIPCAETGEPRLLNSLAVTNLAVPVEELVRYCAARAAIEAWFGRTTHHSPEDPSQQVDSFLQTYHLDERDNSSLLSRHLLRTNDGLLYYTPPQKQELLNQAEGAGHKQWEAKLGYVAQLLNDHLNHVLQRWLPEQEKALEKKAAELLQDAMEAAGNKAEEILKNHGHEAAEAFLQQLATAMDQVQSALTQKMKQKEHLIHEATENFNRQCRRLKEAKAKWFGGDPPEVSAIDEAVDQLKTIANERLYCLAASAALHALNQRQDDQHNSWTTRLRDWAQLVQNWQKHEVKTVEKLEDWSRSIVTAQYTQGYTLEWLAMLSRDFEDFYKQAHIPHDDIRRKIAEYRARYKHEPAFGSITMTHLSAEEDAALCLQAAAEVLSPLLRKQANVIEVVLKNRDKETPRAEYLKRKLELLFDVCQPFWSTSSPPGEPRFETLMAVSMPITRNGTDGMQQHIEELKQAVSQLCQEYGYRPEVVEDGYPFALTVMLRTYGARAYYLSSANRMRHFYQRRIADPKVKARLHLDKRFFDNLPPLHPVENQHHADELWSWAVAYGYIALQGDSYYIGIHETTSGELVPKYETEWQIALTDKLPPQWGKWRQKRPLHKDKLGDGREAAYKAFLFSQEYQKLADAARVKLEKQVGRNTIAMHLGEYIEQLVAVVNAEPSERRRERLNEEMEALRRYIQHLQRED